MFKVSIIIPTYNRVDCLINACESFKLQDYGNFELIIIDQSENTPDVLLSYFKQNSFIKYFRYHPPNRCKAKSFGVTKAAGEIVLICDDDIIAPQDLISKHVSHYMDEEIGAVSCRICEDGQPITYTKNILKFTFFGRLHVNAHSLRSKYVEFLNGGNMSFRKSIFNQIGYFDDRFIGTGIMEEPDIAYRIRKLGYKIFFDATTTVMHYPQNNGNNKSKERQRAIWYHDFFHNFVVYHRKYNMTLKVITYFPYCLLLTLKQSVWNRISFKDTMFMIKGYFDGFKFELP